MTPTILWHDYETWGVNPSVDFPVQFAAIRTDAELNILEHESPINIMCQMPHDYLPHPGASLVTGLTPFMSFDKGLNEPSFAKQIHKALNQANTCSAGYNNIKFDEEVTRHLFHRNFLPVYDREYSNNNSRWDIIDLVRACYALRPEGINWPIDNNEKPSFKLENLTQENNIEHQGAHDALSDVRATIAMAKLVKTHQPKLYDFYWKLRSKQAVFSLINKTNKPQMLVHVSSFISASQACTTLIMPVCAHPNNRNAVVCIDLLKPIGSIVNVGNLNDEQIAANLRTEIFESPELKSDQKAGVFSLFANKCPFIAPIQTLSEDNAKRLGIDLNLARQNFEHLKKIENLSSICHTLFARQSDRPTPKNVDQSLYSTDFPDDADKILMKSIVDSEAQNLDSFQGRFSNEIRNDQLFRYRARHFPHLLSEHEQSVWHRHLEHRFTVSNKTECLSLQEFFSTIEVLMEQYQNHPNKVFILKELVRYGQSILGE